jgi:tRNA threonylcarbamoyladenosine biosynthesis protein TsaE
MIKRFTLNDIPTIAKMLVKDISKNQAKGARIVTLSGDLGAGKTTLTKEIAKILGVKKEIVSPTFVIMKRYEIKNKNFKNLIHIDAYRLKNGNELAVLGWEEMSQNKENLIIIEWPEMVEDGLFDIDHKIVLSHIDENTRSIEILL